MLNCVELCGFPHKTVLHALVRLVLIYMISRHAVIETFLPLEFLFSRTHFCLARPVHVAKLPYYKKATGSFHVLNGGYYGSVVLSIPEMH